MKLKLIRSKSHGAIRHRDGTITLSPGGRATMVHSHPGDNFTGDMWVETCYKVRIRPAMGGRLLLCHEKAE